MVLETTPHFLFHCPNLTIVQRKPKINHKINQVTGTTSRRSNSTITMVLLFGDNKLDFETNEILLTSTTEFTSLQRDLFVPYLSEP